MTAAAAADTVRCRRDARTATLLVDRPPLNVLDLETLDRLDRALAGLAADPDLQVVVVAGGGERAFSAGVAVEDHTPDKVERMLTTFHRALGRLTALPAVTVARVHGHCLGGGLELAASCDLVIAAESAGFGQPEVDLGCFPPWAAATYPAKIGRAATLELLTTGRRLSAGEAARLGLVHRVVPDDELERATGELVAAIAAKSAAVTRLIKRAVAAGDHRGGGEAAAIAACERLYLDELCATEDMEEGLAAFLAKRPPSWRHR